MSTSRNKMAPPMKKKTISSCSNIGIENPTKKKFNKKLWRQNQYKKNVGNLQEGRGFAENRKRAVMQEYRKMLKKEKSLLRASDMQNSEQKSSAENSEKVQCINRKIKMTALQRAQEEYNRKQEEKQQKREEAERIREEKIQAIKKYKEKKAAKLKILSRKTPRGQPVMKGRMELLLEKIKHQLSAP